MSQTDQQKQVAATAKPRQRKDWELFWRIIAGLMLIVIAWVVWVLYQITPRSVVTPLVYESRAGSIGTAQTPAGAAAPATSPTPAVQAEASGVPVSQRAADAAAADAAMDQAQAAARAGAHQSSADVQAAALEKVQEQASGQEQLKREGLKLSTEITTPLVEKKGIAGQPEGKPRAAPADTAGKVRP